MKNFLEPLLVMSLVLLAAACTPQKKNKSDYPISPVDFTRVELTDDFWAPRLETNRTMTIPFALQQNEDTGRNDNFAIAGGLLEGEYKGERYNDTDVYKVLEGAAYSLALHPDPELEAYLDDLIGRIASAQEDDGYLFTPRTSKPDPRPIGIGDERWSNLAVSHELYNAGHLYEAAVAHHLGTGKKNFLDIALKNADLVCDVFGPDKRRGAPGHQVIEMGLVKLYRVTGRKKYLEQAKYFLDQRGRDLKLKIYPEGHRFAIYNDPVQIQAHLPVIEQEEAVGHAVRAMYMYAGMADVAALTGDSTYMQAIDRLWDNVVGRKMYLTGGVGARHHGESFGANYELPNRTAYNETCASIGEAMWNLRLFLLHGDARYLDILERVLYNGVLVGVSLSGDTFFYPCPLESDGKWRFNKGSAIRQPWFGTACCPGNIARFLPSVPGYIYAHKDDQIYVSLFVGSRMEIEIAGQALHLQQETRYPWDGRVQIAVDPSQPVEMTMHIRIPGWARGQPVPSDLYRYLETDPDVDAQDPHLAINGQSLALELQKGFAVIRRTWNPGDKVQLELPMPVRRVLSHERVESNLNRVALERGPLVYCIEAVDNGGRVLDLSLADTSTFKTEYRQDLLQGVVIMESDNLLAIPYYAWAHRGSQEMAVWLHRNQPPQND
jgi:DUF1680 family protein